MDHRDDSRSPARPRSEDLDRLYDEDYFSGRSSGYGSGGYRQDHPDWDAWLDVIQRIQPRGRLVDLGCAFGFLVEKSRSRGYRATGLDVSRHALLQEPSLRPFLARADLHHHPRAEGAADVVALFDVLEHLNDPLLALREASRILSPEGLLVGATPDPVFFNRPEPTHIFERPPSFWLSALEDLGLAASFRFSEEPYNFQFVAARRGSDTAGRLSRFQHDHVDEVPDFFIFGEALQGAPRQGWGTLRQGSRRLARSPALLYLYNPARTPQRLVIRFGVAHSPDFALLRVRLDSLVLLELPLTAEKCAHQVEAPAVLLPSGGHHLFFELLPDGPEVNLSELRIESSPARTDDLAVTLPFDLYQRYRLAGELCRILDPSSILDVGGYLGDADGHLATSADFLSPKPDRVRSTDLRQLDWPRHHPAKAWEQPCGDASFDMAVSLDVLEHLPEAERPRFLAELDRISKRWIVLGGPFRSAEVVEAERELSASLLQDRAFLDEHQQEGLPEIE